MSIAMAAEVLHSTLIGQDVIFDGVSIDSRTLNQGDLFIALKGDRFDGHNYIAEAIAAGAIGAVVSRSMHTTIPYIVVDDTRTALGDLAAYWRQHFDIPVIAVTGSNGKTTVKEMIASIMSEKCRTLATRGNLNNDIGVPLTLLRLRRKHKAAVIEMGMNHPGEIYYVTMLARPSVAVITNVSDAHIGEMGSLDAIARAKGEIFAGLSPKGTAIINADDPFVHRWRTLVEGRRCLTFGLDEKADITATYELTPVGSKINLKTPRGSIEMSLSLLGKHNVMNALAASAASLSAGAELSDIKAGLKKLQAVNGRLQVKAGINGARVIDDTYNANPASLTAALEVLKDSFGERILVLGDMAELGDASPEIHNRVGELAKRVGVGRLYAVGELTKHAVEGFGSGARHFSNARILVDTLLDNLHADMTVLVKGSRKMRMEEIVKGITSPDAGKGE